MTEYKCPECSMWDNGFLKEGDKMRCSECDYLGTVKEFTAKKYNFHVQSIVKIVAFDENDAKEEFELFKEDFEPYFHKVIKIEEV